MNRELENAKKIYESKEIPKELDLRVNEAIDRATKKRRYMSYVIKPVFTGLVIAASLSFILLNTNKAVAKTIYEIPFIGTIAKVFTITEYEFEEKGYSVNVKVPKVSDTGKEDMDKAINDKIQSKIDELVNSVKERSKESDSDGNIVHVDISYEIYLQNSKLLSLAINNRETYASSYEYKTFYNYDLENDKELSLSDLLGEDYKNIVREKIKSEISERLKKNSDFMYNITTEDIDKLEDFNFYINKDEKIIVNFGKGEIAPPPMGEQEFEIAKLKLN
jgi:hypothetical protein